MTAASRPATSGKPPISDKRALLVGTNVFHDELIANGATDATFLFGDSMTV